MKTPERLVAPRSGLEPLKTTGPEAVALFRNLISLATRTGNAALLSAVLAACGPNPPEDKPTPPVPVQVDPGTKPDDPEEVDTTPPDAPVIMTNGPIVVGNVDTAFVPVSVDKAETFHLQSGVLNANGEVTNWQEITDFTPGMQNVNAVVPAPSQVVFRAGDNANPINWSKRTASAAEVEKDIEGPTAPQLGQTSYLLPSTATSFVEPIIVASDARTLNVYRDTSKIMTQAVSGGENLNLTVPHPAGEAHTYAFETEDGLGNSGAKAEAGVEAALAPDGTKAVFDTSQYGDFWAGAIYPGTANVTNATSWEVRIVPISVTGAIGTITPSSGQAPTGETLNGPVAFTWDTGLNGQSGDTYRIDLVVKNVVGEEKVIPGDETYLH
jgi:hypothetical protein